MFFFSLNRISDVGVMEKKGKYKAGGQSESENDNSGVHVKSGGVWISTEHPSGIG